MSRSPLTRRDHRPTLAALVTALMLGAGACAAPEPAAPTAGPTPSSAAPAPAPEITWVPSGPSPVGVPGSVPQHRSYDDPTRPSSVRWYDLPDAGPLNDALAAWAEDSEKAFLEDNPPGTTAPPELAADAVPILNAGDLRGVRAQWSLFAGANGAVDHRTWYYRLGEARPWAGTDLLAPGGTEQIAKAVVDAFGADRTDMAALPVDRLTADLWFTPDGGLSVGIPQGTALASSEGAKVVSIPAARVDALLSDSGRQVRDAAQTTSATTTSPGTAPTSTEASDIPQTPPTSSTAPPPAAAVDCATAKCVALTFDDGPGPSTDKLLDELAAAKAPATFFVLGQSAASHPETIRRAVSLGMAVGSHTWDHRQLTQLTAAQQRTEQERTAEVLTRLGANPALLRPPYGAFNATTRTLGAALILWDVDTEDWKNRSAAVTTQRALAGAHPGAIILMHDVHPSTIAAVPGIVEALRRQGYTLVTVPQLVGGQPATGTAVYGRGQVR